MRCTKCGQKIHGHMMLKRKKLKGIRIRAALQKRKDSGQAIGRPKKRNDKEISDLRSLGHSLRYIARKLNISTYTVHRSLKESK